MPKNNQTYTLIGAAVALVIIAVAGFFLYEGAQSKMVVYTNSAYGISFSYPNTYDVKEATSTDRYTIALVDKQNVANFATASENPRSVTFEIFKNPKSQTPLQWVKLNSASRFDLSPTKQIASTTYAGKQAVAYVWSGLYQAETYVFPHDKSVVMITVTYDSPDDQIHRDFVKIMQTLAFQ